MIVIFSLFGIFLSIFRTGDINNLNFFSIRKKIEFEQLLKFERIFIFGDLFENPTKCLKQNFQPFYAFSRTILDWKWNCRISEFSPWKIDMEKTIWGKTAWENHLGENRLARRKDPTSLSGSQWPSRQNCTNAMIKHQVSEAVPSRIAKVAIRQPNSS